MKLHVSILKQSNFMMAGEKKESKAGKEEHYLRAEGKSLYVPPAALYLNINNAIS